MTIKNNIKYTTNQLLKIGKQNINRYLIPVFIYIYIYLYIYIYIYIYIIIPQNIFPKYIYILIITQTL